MFFATQIETLLSRVSGDEASTEDDETITLKTFLDEDEIIAECRASNKRLVEYLTDEERLVELVSYVTGTYIEEEEEGEELGEEKLRKYALIASEVLASDDTTIATCVVANSAIMSALFAAIDEVPESRLGTDRAIHVSKVISSLLRVKNAEVLGMVLARPSFLQALLVHIGTSPIADLFVRMLDGPESERLYGGSTVAPKKEAIDLLENADVLNRLGDRFVKCAECSTMDDHLREQILGNIASVVIGLTARILQMAKMFVFVPVRLNPYKNPKTIGRMIEAGVKDFNVTNGGRFFALVCSLNVASELMTTEANEITVPEAEFPARAPGRALTSMISMSQARSPQWNGDTEEDPAKRQPIQRKPVISTLELEGVLRNSFDSLVATLVVRGPCNNLVNSSGLIEQPLGWARLKIVEFLVACWKRGTEDTIHCLDDLDVPQTLLNIFFKYEWNSMLHHTVTSAVLHALQGDSEFAQNPWFNTDLLTRIVDVWEEETAGRGDMTLPGAGGHLGHLIVLAGAIEAFFKQNSSKKNMLTVPAELATFEKFCQTQLEEALLLESKLLGGVHPGSTKSEGSVVVEENTDVLEVDSMMADLANAGIRITGRDDSDEDEGEVEVVDTDLPVDELPVLVSGFAVPERRSDAKQKADEKRPSEDAGRGAAICKTAVVSQDPADEVGDDECEEDDGDDDDWVDFETAISSDMLPSVKNESSTTDSGGVNT